ncbi:hypothetical protein BHE74_00026326, partial [Ensete ventricosum]
TVVINDETVRFEIWDTAGQERYHCLAPIFHYYFYRPHFLEQRSGFKNLKFKVATYIFILDS